MPDSSDGESSHSSPLRFFIQTSSKTLALHANPNETITNIISRIIVPNEIPSNCLHLHYGNRHLPSEWTLSRCGVANDSILQLVCCIEMTRSGLQRNLADKLITLVGKLLRDPLNYRKSIKEEQVYDSVKTIVEKFVSLNPTVDNNDTMCYMKVFFDSGAHISLGQLYRSPSEFHRNLADFAVRQFLQRNFEKLKGDYHVHLVPVLLILCNMFAGFDDRRELYLHCQRSLGCLLDSKGWKVFKKPKGINFALEFYPFVVELANHIMLDLSSESIFLSRTDVAQFYCFLGALRREMKDEGRRFPIPKEILHLVDWIACLHKTFLMLLKKLDESLKKIEAFVVHNDDIKAESKLREWTYILTFVSHCRKFGEIYEGGSELFHQLLVRRRVALNALIKRALRNADYYWFLEHKDVTDFEARKNLVMMMFPNSSNDFSLRHEMLINRSRLLDESFMYIGQVDANKLHKGLFVAFDNEEATGFGVLREWFCLVCQAIFSPPNVLFLSCPNDRRRFFPNPASSSSVELQYFSFAGRVIALALRHKIQVGITFDRLFFLQLAGKAITLEDIQDADPFLHMSCKKILKMDEEVLDSDALGLTFVREIEEQGSRRSIEICPGGKNIALNSKNRNDFVNLLIQNCFVESISKQTYYFRRGFSDMLSRAKLNTLFFQSLDLEDFDRMLVGSEDIINVEDWKAHTEYRGYSPEDQQISWFWKVVEEMPDNQKRILLRFWTSIRYLPVEGFSGLESKLIISKFSESEHRLPSAQTCFYSLFLPPYASIYIMYYKLQLITQEHMSCTFGFC